MTGRQAKVIQAQIVVALISSAIVTWYTGSAGWGVSALLFWLAVIWVLS